MSSKHMPLSSWLLPLFAVAALLLMGLLAAPKASADRPGDQPLSGRELVSGVVRIDPRFYARPSQQFPLLPGVVVSNVDTTNDPRAQNETTIDINPLNSNIRVGGENDYRLNPSNDVNCGYAYSSDGGLTWSSSYLKGVTKNNGGPFDYDAAGDPSVYFADNGTVYYACLGFDRSYARSAILVAKSSNGGATWSTPVAVAQSGSLAVFHDKEMLTVDTSSKSPYHGRVYVAWTEFLNNFASSQVVNSYSSDGGATWSDPAVLSSGYTTVEGASPAVGPDGAVYASWCSGVSSCEGQDTATIRVNKSTDGGATWGPSIAADTFTGIPYTLPGNLFRDNAFPTLAVNPVNGVLYLAHAAWSNATGADMTLVGSKDGGSTWTSPVTLLPNADDQFFQWLRISPTGVVWVCYYDQHWNTQNFLDVSCAFSKDGRTFSRGQRVTSQSSDPANDGFGGAFIGDYNGLAIGPGNSPHPLWTDTRTGNANAWTANATK